MTEHRVHFPLPSTDRRDQCPIKAAMQADVDDGSLTWMGVWQGSIWATGIFWGLGLHPHEEEYFVPEILIAADAMYAGLDILRPFIKNHDAGPVRRVVIGVVQGDTHDIGKNLVRIMLEAAGFEVHDLGRDVPAARFVDRAIEVEADIIALSTLMTTTMEQMAEVIRILDARKVRSRFKVIVGGSPLSQKFSDRIGADGYAPKAAAAVQLAKRLIGLELAA